MKLKISFDDEKRLDNNYKEFGFSSRSEFTKQIKFGNVLVNGEKTKSNYKLRAGDELVINRVEAGPRPKNLDIPILYEDDYIIVINKPPFVASHGSKSYYGDSVVDWLLYRGGSLSTVAGPERPGIVHRLDRDTSGLLIIAKNDDVHLALKKQFQARTVKKRYYAISYGSPREVDFEIDAPIARSNNPIKMGIVEGGRDAKTIVHLIENKNNYSLFDVNIFTGRTHQIRVHLSYANFPIVGDPLYGVKKDKIKTDRQMLHSHYISFIHPVTGEEFQMEASPPEDFIDTMNKIGFDTIL
ncbi:MAG: RluA family pseudouridine synthase [Ezakiella sp.]|nr:RluA family pseudouridine synthase [Ezakiella sp.]